MISRVSSSRKSISIIINRISVSRYSVVEVPILAATTAATSTVAEALAVTVVVVIKKRIIIAVCFAMIHFVLVLLLHKGLHYNSLPHNTHLKKTAPSATRIVASSTVAATKACLAVSNCIICWYLIHELSGYTAVYQWYDEMEHFNFKNPVYSQKSRKFINNLKLIHVILHTPIIKVFL